MVAKTGDERKGEEKREGGENVMGETMFWLLAPERQRTFSIR